MLVYGSRDVARQVLFHLHVYDCRGFVSVGGCFEQAEMNTNEFVLAQHCCDLVFECGASVHPRKIESIQSLFADSRFQALLDLVEQLRGGTVGEFGFFLGRTLICGERLQE